MAVNILRHFYRGLDNQWFGKLEQYFAGRVQYFSPESTHPVQASAMGRGAVLRALESWVTHVQGLRIEGLKFRERPDQRAAHVDAVLCYEVTYVMTGRYARVFPELAGGLPANGRQLRLPVTDLVFLDTQQRILRIDRTVDATTLS